MDVIILSIGDELLKGRTLNTNAHHLAGRLYQAGFRIAAQLTVADTAHDINSALDQCFSRAAVVICTGGLGPTRDDVTKAVVSDYFGRELVFDEEYFSQLEGFFRRLGYKEFPELSRNQALVPRGATVLPNSRGTAPGLVLEAEERFLCLLPGVPSEMQGLLEEHLLPLLRQKYSLQKPQSAVVRTVGVGESVIAQRIEHDLSEDERQMLCYYPHGGTVDVVVSAGHRQANAEKTVLRVAGHVASVMSGDVFTRGEKSLWQVVGENLMRRGHSLALAESCTGGLVAAGVTAVPGCSQWFGSGVVCYSNQAKTELLGVPAQLIEQHGVVSEQAAMVMASAAASRMGAKWALALTGVAGPGGGTPDKPLGTVFIAVHGSGGCRAQKFNFSGDREQVRRRSTIKAAELLWRALSQNWLNNG